MKTSVIYLNNATLTVIYELISGSYLKLLVLTLKMVRIRPKRFPPGTVNDLHAVVLDFLKSCRIQIIIFMLYLLKILKLVLFSMLGIQWIQVFDFNPNNLLVVSLL